MINKSKSTTIALIPARGGSKRIPNKNIKPLGNKPLVVWSIETAKSLSLPCYVSTDSSEIADVAVKAGAYVIIRPSELASDNSTDSDVICHAYSQVQANLIAYLRPTTPYRDNKRVWAAIKIMEHYDYPSLRSVEAMPESAYKCFGIRDGWLAPLTKGVDLTDKPNQKLPRTYHPNGYIDIVRGVNVERGEIWGNKRYGLITPVTTELDTLEQWEYAAYKLKGGVNGNEGVSD